MSLCCGCMIGKLDLKAIYIEWVVADLRLHSSTVCYTLTARQLQSLVNPGNQPKAEARKLRYVGEHSDSDSEEGT